MGEQKPRINKLVVVIVMALVIVTIGLYYLKWKGTHGGLKPVAANKEEVKQKEPAYWVPPNTDTITDARLKEQLEYGKDLIAHTSKYFGPKGSILPVANGLNCQNCHLQAGTAIFGNNYGSVASLYPKFRARSGSIENIYKRVNDCFERSLNGKVIDTEGIEMKAIVTYINFIGGNVEKGKKALGSGLKDLPYLNRAAAPQKGQLVYVSKCRRCHQQNGEGLLNADKTEFTFPALWGLHSFNDAAGLYRIINMAKYVKYNMPQGATYKNPQLTDEEAWDVAAFITSQPRPHLNKPKDWPDMSKKPIDLPFGPYADKFSQQDHKYGPFAAIENGRKKKDETIQTK